MGTRLARGSERTISGFLAAFLVSVLTGSVLTVSVTGAAATALVIAEDGPMLVSGVGTGTFGLGIDSFKILFFFGSLALAIIGYSLHPPKFRNDWKC